MARKKKSEEEVEPVVLDEEPGGDFDAEPDLGDLDDEIAFDEDFEDLEGLDDELVDDLDVELDDEGISEVPLDTAIAAEEGIELEPAESEPATSEEEDEEEDVDDDLDEDEVEASLDEILRERLVVVDDEEDAVDEERGDLTTRVLPRQPDEFLCQSCFLVKSYTQLANKELVFCRDCV